MSSRQSFRKGVESALHARDRTGVQDFVLLEDFNSVDAFLDNLRKRFKADLIYVSDSKSSPQICVPVYALDLPWPCMLFCCLVYCVDVKEPCINLVVKG